MPDPQPPRRLVQSHPGGDAGGHSVGDSVTYRVRTAPLGNRRSAYRETLTALANTGLIAAPGPLGWGTRAEWAQDSGGAQHV
jgi:hypothetical protein